MQNSDKLILDLCGGTGSWSEPYRKAGYDVEVLTLPENDVVEIAGELEDWIDRNSEYGYNYKYIPTDYFGREVYGILAAPPCKEFSLAKNSPNRHMKEAPKRDIEAGLVVVNACLKIIELVQPEWWALENPIGLLGEYIGKPSYTFHPWEYGDPWTKRIGIWGDTTKPIPSCISQQDGLDQFGEPIADYFKRNKTCANPRKGFALAFFNANR